MLFLMHLDLNHSLMLLLDKKVVNIFIYFCISY